jgi:DNA-binding NarL/FixJ family response regulator
VKTFLLEAEFMAEQNHRPRVLLADDHAGMLERVRELLCSDFEIVDALSDGLLVREAVERTRPDVIVMDVGMPGQDGIKTAKQLRHLGCTAKIVFLTVAQDEDYITAAFAAGGAAYVLKGRMQLDLIFAMKEALSGRSFISSR